MKERLKWLVRNGLLFTCLYFGFVKGIDGAQNIATAWAWLMSVLSVCYLFDESANILSKNGRRIPNYISVSVDLAVAFTFIWFGSWLTGWAYLAHPLLREIGYAKTNKKETAEDDSNRV